MTISSFSPKRDEHSESGNCGDLQGLLLGTPRPEASFRIL
jgi:hypothetical protein